ncbi:MAG: hypothetical protein ABI375_11915 [Rudaea sp.]
MKISQSNDQLIIDNSLVKALAIGTVFLLVGVGIIVLTLISHDHQIVWWGLGFGALFAIVGGCIIAFSKSTHIVLAKSGDSSMSSKTLFTQSRSQSFALADVATVRLETSESRRSIQDNNGNQRYETDLTSNLLLQTKSAQRIRIASLTQPTADGVAGFLGSLVSDPPLKKQADIVAKFIGVPLHVNDSVIV